MSQIVVVRGVESRRYVWTVYAKPLQHSCFVSAPTQHDPKIHLFMQKHGIHAGACIAAFHTAVALECSCMQVEEIEDVNIPVHFDRCMHILQTAAAHTTSVADELAFLPGGLSAEFEECMAGHVVAARAALDELMLSCQQVAVSKSMLPALGFASERQKLQQFEVQLPGQGKSAPQCAQSLRQKSIDALGGVSVPPKPGSSSSEWCDWLSSLQGSQSWSSVNLCLQQVEQHFFALAARHLTCASSSAQGSSKSTRGFMPHAFMPRQCLSSEDVRKAVELLTVYSQTVAQVEARPGIWMPDQAADDHSPMLLKQFRSRESLLACIVLCLIHHRIATEEWEGIVKYKLPVEADDLRHLVLGCPIAVHAAMLVADYICRVAERSSGAVCFSLESEDTLHCAVDYARRHHALASC